MTKTHKNGNGIMYSTKELIESLHNKVDRIENNISEIKTNYVHQVSCEKRRLTIRNMTVGMFGLLFTLLSALASYVFMKR